MNPTQIIHRWYSDVSEDEGESSESEPSSPEPVKNLTETLNIPSYIELSDNEDASDLENRSSRSTPGAEFEKDLRVFPSPEKFKHDEKYLITGNLSFYNRSNLAKRKHLQDDSEIQNILHKFYKTYVTRKNKQCPGCVHETEAMFVNVLVRKCLLDPKIWSLADAWVVAQEDWEREAKGKEWMSEKQLKTSLFEIADVWTNDIEKSSYVTFLEDLYKCITKPTEEKTARKWKDIEAVEPFTPITRTPSPPAPVLKFVAPIQIPQPSPEPIQPRKAPTIHVPIPVAPEPQRPLPEKPKPVPEPPKQKIVTEVPPPSKPKEFRPSSPKIKVNMKHIELRKEIVVPPTERKFINSAETVFYHLVGEEGLLDNPSSCLYISPAGFYLVLGQSYGAVKTGRPCSPEGTSRDMIRDGCGSVKTSRPFSPEGTTRELFKDVSSTTMKTSGSCHLVPEWRRLAITQNEMSTLEKLHRMWESTDGSEKEAVTKKPAQYTGLVWGKLKLAHRVLKKLTQTEETHREPNLSVNELMATLTDLHKFHPPTPEVLMKCFGPRSPSQRPAELANVNFGKLLEKVNEVHKDAPKKEVSSFQVVVNDVKLDVTFFPFPDQNRKGASDTLASFEGSSHQHGPNNDEAQNSLTACQDHSEEKQAEQNTEPSLFHGIKNLLKGMAKLDNVASQGSGAEIQSDANCSSPLRKMPFQSNEGEKFQNASFYVSTAGIYYCLAEPPSPERSPVASVFNASYADINSPLSPSRISTAPESSFSNRPGTFWNPNEKGSLFPALSPSGGTTHRDFSPILRSACRKGIPGSTSSEDADEAYTRAWSFEEDHADKTPIKLAIKVKLKNQQAPPEPTPEVIIKRTLWRTFKRGRNLNQSCGSKLQDRPAVPGLSDLIQFEGASRRQSNEGSLSFLSLEQQKRPTSQDFQENLHKPELSHLPQLPGPDQQSYTRPTYSHQAMREHPAQSIPSMSRTFPVFVKTSSRVQEGKNKDNDPENYSDGQMIIDSYPGFGYADFSSKSRSLGLALGLVDSQKMDDSFKPTIPIKPLSRQRPDSSPKLKKLESSMTPPAQSKQTNAGFLSPRIGGDETEPGKQNALRCPATVPLNSYPGQHKRHRLIHGTQKLPDKASLRRPRGSINKDQFQQLPQKPPFIEGIRPVVLGSLFCASKVSVFN